MADVRHPDCGFWALAGPEASYAQTFVGDFVQNFSAHSFGAAVPVCTEIKGGGRESEREREKPFLEYKDFQGVPKLLFDRKSM